MHKQLFDIIQGGPDVYVKRLPYMGKSIHQAQALLPDDYHIRYVSSINDYQDKSEHPDHKQYAVYNKNNYHSELIHLYVNNDVIDDTLEVTQ